MKVNTTIYKFVVWGFLLSSFFSCKKDSPIAVLTITTTEVTNITSSSAISGGAISSDGGATVTARGICWSLDQYPTIEDHIIYESKSSSTFSTSISELKPNTTYYIRAFATNSLGTAYGNMISFSTKELTMVDVDGNIYHTVTIGSQIWTVENLKTTKYRNGDTIPNVTDNTAWYHLKTGAYVLYNNDKSNKSTYGALYNWYAVTDSRNIAPVGWHIPSDAEWTALTNFLFGEKLAAGKLSETGTTHWVNSTDEVTNETGFTALPGGYHSDYITSYDIGLSGYWWSTTEVYTTQAWVRIIPRRIAVYRSSLGKASGFSVRCIKDN